LARWDLGIDGARVKPFGCGSLVKLLADYLERRLPTDVHADLTAHLQECPRCVAQLKTYESTVSMLRSLRDEDLPPELRLTVKSFIDAKCRN
jgi:anti-sigma factor RsiW